MTVAEDLSTALKKKDYDGTVEGVRRACEWVLEYRKISERSEATPEAVSRMSHGRLLIMANSMPLRQRVLTADKFCHYGNSSEIPEGIISHVTYSVDHGIFRLAGEPNKLVEFCGYGKVWDDYGYPVQRDFDPNLKIPTEPLNEVSVEGFIKKIQEKEIKS